MTGESKVVLLTGFPTSLLARKLVSRLLDASPDVAVKCLVPDAQLDAARQAVSALPKPSRARVEFVKGEPSSMDFGMSGRRYLALARSVSVVHHCAGVWHGAVSREKAERANITSAGEVVDLALAGAGRIERVVHWSSALLNGARSGRVSEGELVRPSAFRSVIDETRFRAEQLMRDAMSQLPITILRPSILVGDSKTGEIDQLDGPYLLVLLMLSAPADLRVPLPGRGDQPLDLVPLDYVVDAGVAIANDVRSAGRTFHLIDPNPLTVRRVFELIADATGRHRPRGHLPTNLAAALLRAPGVERFSHIPRTFLEQLATNVIYDARNTRELLAGTGIECPSAATYLKVMVDHVRRTQTERAARNIKRDPHFEELVDPLD
jgi:thioester reductase-like protein